MKVRVDEREIARLRRRLLAQARLFEHPPAYEAGVEDTLRALEVLQDEGVVPIPEPFDDRAGRML